MNAHRFRAWMLGTAICAALAGGMLRAEEVPYVQTPRNVVDAMLELGGVRGRDFLFDLGSGDGRIVITAAARYGTRGVGVDYDPYLIERSTAAAAKAGVSDRVRFLRQDIFDTDLSSATVVTMYLLPEVNLALRPRLLQLRPGTRIVSHDWDMGDWPPDAQVEVAAPDKPVGVSKTSTVSLWIVPARLEGRWRTRVPTGDGTTEIELEFAQAFQALSGTARMGEHAAPIERTHLRGSLVLFRVEIGDVSLRFEGHATHDRIVGRVSTRDGRSHPWRALRAPS